MLSDDELAAIEARCNAATAGPWYTVGSPWGDNEYIIAGGHDPHGREAVLEIPFYDDCPEVEDRTEQAKADLSFAAHSRQDIPALIAEVRRLQEVRDHKQAVVIKMLSNFEERAFKAECERDRLRKALELAWGVIANVSGGDWSKQSVIWQEAAARWRDEFFASNALQQPGGGDAGSGEGEVG